MVERDRKMIEHSLVIPAYNEEKIIGRLIKKYTFAFRRRFPSYEIIVIADGDDKTAKIVKAFSKTDRNIKILEFERRLGKGAAVHRGFDFAKGNTIGFTDADGSVSSEDYIHLVEQLDGCDCAIASRRADGARILRNRSFAVKTASFIFNKLVNLFFNLGIKDTQCGAKVLRRDAYDTVRGELRLAFFEFDVELLWRLKQHGFKINEVPITWTRGKKSGTYLRNSPRLLFSLIKLRLGL